MVHLFPYALFPPESGTVHGFSRVTSLSTGLCSSHTWCAAYLPPLSDSNTSVQLPSLTGANSGEKPCWCSWSTALRRSAVLTTVEIDESKFISDRIVHERTGAHTNTIECRWGQIKAYLGPYNRKEDYIHHLPHYMFATRCRVVRVDDFTKFLSPAYSTDFSVCPPPYNRPAPCDLLIGLT
jgi:hypothetical protein